MYVYALTWAHRLPHNGQQLPCMATCFVLRMLSTGRTKRDVCYSIWTLNSG